MSPSIFADDDEKQKDKDKKDKIKLKEEKFKEEKAKFESFFVPHESNSEKIDKKILKLFKKPKEKPEFGLAPLDIENHTAVYVYLDKPESVAIIPKDIEITGKDDNIIVAKLSLDQMNQLANSTSVLHIGQSHRAEFFGHQINEGVVFSNADEFHLAGINGAGVTVAVIDDSFFVTNPEIQPNVIFSTLIDSSGFCGGSITCGMAPGDSHGTAVAETIVDMAPAVSLRLYAIGNSVDFNNAVDDAVANGADIITASLGFPTAGGDGVTGFFRDGTSTVAKKVNDANNAGALVTIAAANDALTHWKGPYVASSIAPVSLGLSGYQSVLEFQPSASGDQRACLPVVDSGGFFIATWNDWAASSEDYDFLLYDSAMSAILAGSADFQMGTQPPIEVFDGTAPSPTARCLVVASWLSSQNHQFHVYTDGNSLNSAFRVRSGSIGTPADATGAMAIGAVYHLTDVLEAFSSSGPTDDGRAKPEICGPDGTSSHQTGFLNPFFGTSAATPHVAGAAALFLEQDPSLSVVQLRNNLINNARFNAAYSVDNLCGQNSGALQLPPPPQNTCGISFPQGTTIDYGQLYPNTKSAQIQLDVLNTGNTAATLTVSGQDWKDSANNLVMSSDRTHYATVLGTPYENQTPLGLPSLITSSFAPGVPLSTYWQLEVILQNSLFLGTVSQQTGFTVSC